MRNKKVLLIIALVVLIAIFLTGCVPGDGSYDADRPAGFWWGLWHGLIVWITFFMGLFTGGKYTIYEAINTGWPYNLGFLIGLGSSVGGGIKGGSRLGSRKSKYVCKYEPDGSNER